MAYSEADRDRLKRAIASGVLTVKNSDGRLVTYRSLSDLKAALAAVDAELAVALPGVVRTRRVVLTGRSGF